MTSEPSEHKELYKQVIPPVQSAHRAREILDGLRRDISAARLRVSLDERLDRKTPAAVKKLASLPEPPQI